MTATLLDGTAVAKAIKDEVASEVTSLALRGLRPGLAAVLAGNDPASRIYVSNKVKTCEQLGIFSEKIDLPESTTTDEMLALVRELNLREEIDGILIQLPLPKQVDTPLVLTSVDPAKDVDGFHPVNIGKLSMGRPIFAPCTPAGIIELLERSNIPISGTNACVVGRSQIVGRPMAQLLLQRDATVTIAHSRTRDLESVTSQADLLIVAIGRPGFVGREHIKPGATVIDVGMNRLTDETTVRRLFGDDAGKRLETIARRGYTMVGDVNPSEADEVAGWRTPVPGGVGLLTVAMLMRNTVKAAKLRRGLGNSDE